MVADPPVEASAAAARNEAQTSRSLRLAKDRLDVGLFATDPSVMEFVATVTGDDDPEQLQVARGVVQHRFDIRGSIIKVNLTDAPPERMGHILEVVVAADVVAPSISIGPGGVRMRLVPGGHEGTEHLDVVVGVTDLTAARAFYAGLGRLIQGDRVAIGASSIVLRELTTAPLAESTWDYVTVQIHDCNLETTRAVDAGASVVYRPRTSGSVARYSIVADPFGNLIELSQRASLTGPLPQ